MEIISLFLRCWVKQIDRIWNFFRILKLNLLYPGLSIDYASTIGRNCKILCIKGGILDIKNSSINAGVTIIVDYMGILSISKSFIGPNCVIVAKKEINIKDGCLIAEMVVIRDADHLIDVSEKFNTREQFATAAVTIEQNVWIASKATILKGVTVGENSVVAASAVVNKSIPPLEVWGGIPAKYLRRVEIISNTL